MARTNGFILIEHDLIRTAAWQSLHGCTVAVLIDVWSKHNGKNNGQIAYSYTDARQRFGWSNEQIAKRFFELQLKGFLVVTSKGHFQVKAGSWQARKTMWRLTMEPCNGKPPTRDYLRWSPDA